ncbi:MAG: DUF488 domain-containing protein [Deltaproteobacteria bacterium]|nr:DUF488 domain-containing protein [Deltaproteobacteria bacterium]
MYTVRIKRIYDKPSETDGFRILVDRLWPRGMSKKDAKVGLWLKEIAPGDNLRKWFGHDPEKWYEFKRRYFKELDSLTEKQDLLNVIIEYSRKGAVTLLYAAKDEDHNNAVAIMEYLHTKYEI